jgi:hypothetical protein
MSGISVQTHEMQTYTAKDKGAIVSESQVHLKELQNSSYHEPVQVRMSHS